MKLPCGHHLDECHVSFHEDVIFVRCPRCINAWWSVPSGQIYCVRCGDPAEEPICPLCERAIESALSAIIRVEKEL